MSAGTAAPRGNITGYKQMQMPNFTPEQMQLFQRMLGGLQGGGLEGGMDFLNQLASGSEKGFAEAEKPAYAAFQKSLGDIGSRFSGFGGGSLDSSGFQQAASGAAQGLAENLGANRMNLRQGAIDKLLGLSGQMMGQKPFETFMEPESKGMDWGSIIGSLLGSFGGPAAGALGGGIGKAALPKLLKLLGLGK